MGSSDSEGELKKKKKEKKDKGSGDEKKEKRDRGKEERKEGMDREKEERKAKADREKEERKAQKDKEKEQRDKEKEERKGKLGKKKEERDREKEERKERKDKEKEGRDKDGDEKKKHRDDFKHEGDHPPRPSGSRGHGGPADVHGGKAADHHNVSDTHSRPPLPEETPWFLRESGSVPSYEQSAHIGHGPSIHSPPPQYSIHPPPPLRAVNDGAVPPVQNVPPSGYRIPLSPNVQFPVPDHLGRPPATDFDGSTPVFIGSAIFPDSVHPCRIIPSLQSPCRVLCEGSEVEHHGRYDLLPVTDNMEWVPSKNGEIPPGRRPVEGGYESNVNKLYHALGFVQGIYIPGKTGQHLRGAIVPFGGTEHHLPDNYSVLCWK